MPRPLSPGCRLRLLFALAACILPAGDSGAESINEVLATVYRTNPTLSAEWHQFQAVAEGIPAAQASWAPQVSITGAGYRQATLIHAEPANLDSVNSPMNAALTLTQAIYHGGAIEAGVGYATKITQAEAETLRLTEISLLLQGATAYLDLLRDMRLLEIDRENERNLEKQLKVVQERFAEHEQTKVDIDQSESRLASAQADSAQAEGQVEVSRGAFVAIVGKPPELLDETLPALPLPSSLAEALARAEAQDPGIARAKNAHHAAEETVTQAEAAFIPSVDLVAQYGRYWNETTTGVYGQYDIDYVGIQLTVPLYSGGANSARLRAAKNTERVQLDQIDQASRSARLSTTQAWQGLVSARTAKLAYQRQVAAAQRALEGVRQQQTLGVRTVLDVLNADQEWQVAQLQLARMAHDEAVASYALMAATGTLTAQVLELDERRYDPEAVFDDVTGKILRP